MTDEESELTREVFDWTKKAPITTAAVVTGNQPIRAKQINETAAKTREKNAGKRKRTTHVSFFWEGGKGWECGGLIGMARKLLTNSQLRKSRPKRNFLVSFLTF